MSQNTHTGVGQNRRPINQKNAQKRLKETANVLNFLKGRSAK